MNEKKNMIRYFAIADFEEEETWLCEQHRKGWKLVDTTLPCFYHFESCPPENVVYRLDYQNAEQGDDYLQLFRDYGWEYFNSCAGWLYFRKPVSDTEPEEDAEIFSDDSSRLDLLDNVFRTRMLPLLLIFVCCLLPSFMRSINNGSIVSNVLTAILGFLTVLYIWLLVYCGVKLRRLREKYGERR